MRDILCYTLHFYIDEASDPTQFKQIDLLKVLNIHPD